jgi:AraC-like DNA-binding protein
MIVQGLTETSYFKKLFIGNNIHIEDVSPSRLKLVSERIKENFYRKKIYKDVNLTLEKTLDILDITKKELSYYLDKNKFANFSDFVNTLRVKEFKELIHSGEYNNKYDLVSIAYLAGFNSKATFYRVFKKIEGITPSKYVKQLL